MKLTDADCRISPPPSGHRQMRDGQGLYLEVTAGGARYWRLQYRFGGRRRKASFGVYPEVSLAEARQRSADARALLRKGIDPVAARREQRNAPQLRAHDLHKRMQSQGTPQRVVMRATSRRDKPVDRVVAAITRLSRDRILPPLAVEHLIYQLARGWVSSPGFEQWVLKRLNPQGHPFVGELGVLRGFSLEMPIGSRFIDITKQAQQNLLKFDHTIPHDASFEIAVLVAISQGVDHAERDAIHRQFWPAAQDAG